MDSDAGVLASSPAIAHYPLDGMAMTTFWHGFLSGVAHPVLGIDHLVFILTIGVSAVFASGKMKMAACALVGVFAGVALTIAGIAIPGVETLIAISLIVLGGIVLASAFVNSASDRFSFFVTLLPVAVSVFSVLHGSVYARVLVEQKSLVFSVVAGFVLALPVIYTLLLLLGNAASIGFQQFSRTAFGPTRLMSLLSIGLGVSLLAA